MNDKAIEAAARIIDPLAFEEQGSCPPRGYECHTPEQLNRVIAARRRHALSVAKRMVAAYKAASGEARDAARYWFLAGADEGAESSRWSRWKLEYWDGFYGGWQPLMGTELDAAIDAAIAARKGVNDGN